MVQNKDLTLLEEQADSDQYLKELILDRYFQIKVSPILVPAIVLSLPIRIRLDRPPNKAQVMTIFQYRQLEERVEDWHLMPRLMGQR